MRVQVLTVLPSQEPLVESAMASWEGRPSTIPLLAARTAPSLEIDPTFAAIAVGSGRPAETTVTSMAPEASERFVVRGFIEAEDPSAIPAMLDGEPVFADPVIAPFAPTCAGSAALGNAAQVRSKLSQTALAGRGLTGDRVAIAIMDTGINLAALRVALGMVPRFDVANSWTPPGGGTAPFAYPVDHGTMCAYDALIMAPKATLLDYPVLAANAPGGGIVGRTLSVAVQGFAKLLAFWAVAFAGPVYNGLVVNNSWGIYHPSWDFPAGHPGRYVDNPNHPFMLLVSVLARTGADILFAAGNCGAQCPDGRCQTRVVGSIMGANASADVLTLAGCDVRDSRVGYSSQGPSIAGMPQQKPDLTAYTHFLGSQAFGPGSPDTGTSAACPVAAGCVAAIRTHAGLAAVPPAHLMAQLKATARNVHANPGWNGDYGHGIIDPDAAAQSVGV